MLPKTELTVWYDNIYMKEWTWEKKGTKQADI